MTKGYRWGIIGTGYIADLFCSDLISIPHTHIAAVVGDDPQAIDLFANKFRIPFYSANFDAFLSQPFDIIYVATPHHLHPEQTIAALKAGKHVLCEKPMAVNATLAAEMFATANREQRLLMEAVWVRFLPGFSALCQLIDQKVIGEIRRIDINYCFKGNRDSQQRLFDPAYGGGSLLDVGVYGLFLLNQLLGKADQTFVHALLNSKNVDEAISLTKHYIQRNAVGTLQADITAHAPIEATIIGEEGYIKLCSPWFTFEKIQVSKQPHHLDTYYYPFEGRGYQFEAQAFMAQLAAYPYATEHPDWSHADTISQLSDCDAIRKQIQVHYPQDDIIR